MKASRARKGLAVIFGPRPRKNVYPFVWILIQLSNVRLKIFIYFERKIFVLYTKYDLCLFHIMLREDVLTLRW